MDYILETSLKMLQKTGTFYLKKCEHYCNSPTNHPRKQHIKTNHECNILEMLHFTKSYATQNYDSGAWWRNGESTWLGIQGSLDRVSPPSLRVVLEKDVNHIFSVGPGELGTLQWVWFEERYLPHSTVWQHVKLSKSPMEKVQKIQ